MEMFEEFDNLNDDQMNMFGNDENVDSILDPHGYLT